MNTYYMHTETGTVDTEEEWLDTLAEVGEKWEDAMLIEVCKDWDGDWVEVEDVRHEDLWLAHHAVIDANSLEELVEKTRDDYKYHTASAEAIAAVYAAESACDEEDISNENLLAHLELFREEGVMFEQDKALELANLFLNK